MKNYLFAFFLLVGTTPLFSQYGINASYETIGAADWEGLFRQSDVVGATPVSSGFSIGVDRWFRLKPVRIEFFPELNYARYQSDWAGNTGTLQHQKISLYANTNFYLLDFMGDCDCPTFSKDGGIFKKGFFVQLSPGVSYALFDFQSSDLNRSSSSIVPSIGLGLGIDIGLSDFITLTPMVRFRQHFGVEWENLREILDMELAGVSSDTETSGVETWGFGLRIGVRFNE